jgi:hypothetical protein
MTVTWPSFPSNTPAIATDIIMGIRSGIDCKFLANSWLLTANNLSDVPVPTTAFNNISPLTTTGDIIYFDGTNNVRLPIGTTNQILEVFAGLPAWRNNPSLTASNLQNQQFVFGVAGGTANALTLTLNPAIAAYADGQYICFKAAANNTAATTIAVNGLAAKAIVTNGNNALVGGELLVNADYMAIYNSTYGAYVLINTSLNVALLKANNLSDVANVTTAFNNISPATTTGDMIYFNGTNNVNLAIGSTNQIMSVVGGIPTWVANPGLLIANNLSDVNNKITSFDNISPAVTTGDMIYFDGTHNVNLAIGATNQIMSVVGSIPTWIANPSPTFVQVQNYALNYAVDSGAANAYIITLSPAPSAYADGQQFTFKATNANSGATTINVNGLGVTPIVTNANAALSGGEILANGQYIIIYNSTFNAFVLH